MRPSRLRRPPKLHEVLAESMLDVLREEKLLLRGDRLPPERVLCERFGVSRTVVRETVKVLVAQGFLKQVGGGGTFISQDTAEPLTNALNAFVRRKASQGSTELFEVRNILEVEIAGLAAERASEKDIENLTKLNRSLATLHRKMDDLSDKELERFNQLDFEFHQTLARCTCNDLFVILVAALSDAFKTTWNRTHHLSENRGHGIEMHDRILNAIRAHDPVAARQATRDNLSAFLLDAEATEDEEPHSNGHHSKR